MPAEDSGRWSVTHDVQELDELALATDHRPQATAHRRTFFRNLVPGTVRLHTLATMSHTPESVGPNSCSAGPAPQEPGRPFRVKLRGSVLALMRLPNRCEVRGKLHQLSTTGGLLNVERPLDEKLEVELVFHLGEATIREKAEIMFPMWATQGWIQPFRFIDLPEASKRALQTSLLSFVQPQPAS
jgi:hypothetical protein